MATTIREELVTKTDIRTKKGEDDDAFRQRLLMAVSELEDEEYANLNFSKAARKWSDQAIAEFNKSGSVPAFADEEEPEQEEEHDEATEEDEPETETTTEDDDDMTHVESATSSRRGRKAPPPKVKAKGNAKRETVAKKEGNSAPRKAGTGLHYARKLLAKTPDIAIGDLHEKVKKAGHDISSHTLSTTKSGFLATVKALQESGLLKKNLV